jgi:hypothetical protein
MIKNVHFIFRMYVNQVHPAERFVFTLSRSHKDECPDHSQEKNEWIKSRSPRANLSTLATDAAGKLDILRHDRHTLGVDGAQVGILKEANKVGFRCFLERQDSRGLETKIVLKVLGNLTDKALEGSLADKELGALLVLADLTKSDGSRSVTVGLLDTSGCGGGLARSLGGELLAGSLSSGGLAGGLLGTGHGC